MSFRLVTHTPTIGASPGESVIGRVEIFNDGATDAVYTVRVVGLAPDPLHESAAPPPLRMAVPAGTSATADVVVAVPRTLGIGQHAAAFEATSSRSGDRAALTPFTVSIQSVARVELVPQPSTIRARRKARFHLDVTNNEALAVDIALSGEAPDVTVSFSPPAMTLQPGQRAVAKAAVRGPRHWSGERTQHTILITARGRASSTSVTAAYVQRPLFAHRFRMVLAGLTVVALWLAAIGGAALWLSNRDDGTDAGAVIVGIDTDGDGIPDAFRDADGNPVTGTDTNGDGIPDEFRDADGNLITGTDTDGDGIPDTLVDAEGRPLKAIDTDGDGKPDTLSNGAPLPDDLPATAPEPQATILRGTVEIDGDPSAVAIALTPIELGAAPSPSATPIGLRAAQPSEPEGKIWSARTTTLNDVVGSPTRRTVAIEPDSTVPGADGVWLFTDVLQGQSYEVSFSSPGYDTQSFVLTPRADGEPIDLDVVMKPANGSLSGTVVGPSGPLGGAEIRITDGTLEFVSTSASGNGTWSLSGVSTPGIYTVTATLRGFATAVRQVRLAPGDTPTGISLQMVPGLGTITGLVTTNGTALGGVTVTASNGETTLTTTTLTEGNIGFYSLPQLPAPAEYTVQAQLDGYVTNSRRVPLSGSLSGVDFSMTSTTSTLTGRVLSSGGGGIESAGLVVSTGELQFRASTSPTGAFEIDRLPPGDYTITVEHFQHESITEFTTLTAGSTPTPLTITLPLSTGPPDVGAGSLVVSVINEDSTIVPAGINNARVTISRNRSADVRVLQDPDASAVTFEDLPIGTWTINVTAAGYNVSAPVTRSVGLARERAEIRLQRLGSASGTMINSLDGTPLTGYTVNLFRLQNDTDTVGTPAGSFTANAAGAWSTPADALPTGVYRLQATSPLGFFVRNDQILDTSPEVKNRTMSFLVPVLTDAEVKPLVIAPIEADPYPTITGKIYEPRLNGVAVEYDAVDEPSLAVSGVCNGEPVPASDISITDAFGPTGGAPDLFDTFSITKETVAGLIPIDGLPGTCSFTVEADNRVDATISLSNIQPSDGRVSSDRLAAAALVTTPAPLTGTVFWFDKGPDPDARVPLGNVAIAAAAAVITGFETTERSDVLPDPRPVPVLGPSTATSTPTTSSTPGAWTLTGQVFGTSNYVFTTPNFTPGSVPVTINETARVVPPTGTNANVLTEPVDGAGFGIELTPPNPGTVSGRVTIQTSDTPKYGTNMVNAIDPSGATRETTPSPSTGSFSFADAIAGTWNVTFDDLPNHVREPAGTTPAPFDGRLEPGGSITGVDATFTELATVRVRLFDKTTGVQITPSAGLALTPPASPTLTGPVSNRASSAPGPGGVYELTGIPVAASAPATNTVNYRLALQLDGYDLSRSRTGSNPDPLVNPEVDARNYPLPMVAGRVTDVDFYVESLKSITGSVVGQLTGGGTENLSLDGADPAPAIPATVTAQRVDVNGDPITTTDPTPEVIAGPSGTFSVKGAPGFYKITAAHPQYQDAPAAIPSNDGVSAVPNVFLLGSTADTVLASPFELRLRTSTLSVNALTKLTGGTQVDGAVFDWFLGTAPCSTFPPTAPRVTIPTGGASTPFAPGTYCVKVNKFDTGDPTKSIAFPAVVTVTVPRTTVATPGVATVVAPLPALRPTLSGKLVAENQAGGTVELLATDPVVLTSTFTENVAVSVDGSTTANLNPNSNGTRTATAVAPTPPAPPVEQTVFSWTYEFASVPYGTNEITAPAIPGYTLVTANLPVTIDAAGPTDGPTFVYKIDNAPVRIALGPGAYPSLDPAFAATDARATVRLVSKSGAGAGDDRAYTFDASTNTLILAGVAPEVGNWTLSFSDVLHLPFSGTVKIDQKLTGTAPDTYRVGTLQNNNNPVGNLVRLTGTATQQPTNDASSAVALSGDAVMTLAGTTTYTLRATTPPANSPGAKLSGTTYIFDVTPGTYTLTTTKSEYLTRQLAGLALTSAGTVLAGQNVAIQKQSTITVRALNRGLTIPTNLRVDLLNVDNNTIYGPMTLPAAAVDPTDPSVVFNVPAGNYRARTVTAGTQYPQQTSTPDTGIGVGGSTNIGIVLPRITRFNVTGPPSASVSIPGLTAQSEDAGTTIEFTETTTTTALNATVSAPGYRTKILDVPAELFTTTPVTLLPNVTVTGSITAPDEALGNVLTATDGTTTLQGSITGNTYRVAGLTANADGTAKSWTVNYTKIGVGTGSSTAISVSSTAPDTGSTTGSTITVTPRPVNYNFIVTMGASTAVDGASVTITPTPATAPAATDSAGKTTAVVGENVAFTWTVKKTGYLTRYGSFPTATSLADVPVAVSMVDGVSGTVTDATSGVNNATVVVCPFGAGTPCTPVASDRTVMSGALGAFKIRSDLTPGSYTVWASSTSGSVTRTGSTTLTIADNGDASLSPSATILIS